MHKLTPLSCSLLLALAGSLYAAEHPRYGAEDFLPTPQTPIGFQADGNGWYPGATPQVVEWWDGKPGWGKVIHRQGTGNGSPPFDDSSYKEMDLRVFTDRVPKNILWKIPTPGHSDAQPVIVGDRIICTFYPHFTVCYDLKTGKELWRDALEMALLPELGKDRRTVGPAPHPAEARKRQTLFEIAQAMAHLRFNLRDFEGEDPGPAEYPLVRKAIERMGEWRKTLEEVHPPSVALLDEDIALAKRFLAGEHAILGVGQKKMEDDREFSKTIPQFGDPWDRRKNLVNTTQHLLQASISNKWPGWMPFHCTTPCSDGEIVVVRFYQGQVGAYEVATGKLLWAWRDPHMGMNTSHEHARSPRIHGDLVFLEALREGSRTGDGMLGIDKRSGGIRWFTPYPKYSPTVTTMILTSVPDPGHATRKHWPVIVNAEAAILDQATGQRLGFLPHQVGDWYYPLFQGDQITMGGCEPSAQMLLKPDGKGMIAVQPVGALPLKGSRYPTVRNDRFIFGDQTSFDLRTGNWIANGGILGEHGGSAGSVIGDLYVRVGDGEDRKYRPRRDGMVLATFYVADAISRPNDPPWLISNRSLLGGTEAPADIFFDKHLAGFDKMRQINPRKWCGRYGNIITAYFGHYMNGPVARGNRIFIQSQCFLYCIGPAVQGTPADDPQVVAAIRAGKDVEKHLASPSAQYRFEAVKQAKGPAEALKRLVAEDPYEEIRLAAMAALDAADPAGNAGWQTLVKAEFEPAYATEIHWGKPGHRDQQERRKTLPLLLRCLGQKEGSALIARRWPQASKDPVQRRALIEICTFLRWRVEPMYTEAVASLANPKQAWPVAYYVAMDAASDPATAETLMKLFPTNWELYPTLARNLKPDRLLAWIEPIAMASSHPVNRPRIFTAWKAVGKAAVPSMERVKAAMAAKTAEQDRLAAEYAKAIENIAPEMK